MVELVYLYLVVSCCLMLSADVESSWSKFGPRFPEGLLRFFLERFRSWKTGRCVMFQFQFQFWRQQIVWHKTKNHPFDHVVYRVFYRRFFSWLSRLTCSAILVRVGRRLKLIRLMSFQQNQKSPEIYSCLNKMCVVCLRDWLLKLCVINHIYEMLEWSNSLSAAF